MQETIVPNTIKENLMETTMHQPMKKESALNNNTKGTINIHIIAKYGNYTESYKSLHEAIKHAGVHAGAPQTASQASTSHDAWQAARPVGLTNLPSCCAHSSSTFTQRV